MSLKLDGDGPLNRQVYRAVLAAIHGGALRHGERLWSSRSLQMRLGVSRNVILMALAQLTAEGYLEARRGAGTFVNASALSPASPRRTAATPRWAWAQLGNSLQAQPGFDIGGGQPQFLGREFRFDFRYARTHLPAATQADWLRLERRAGRHAFERCSVVGHVELQHAVAAYLRRSRGVVAAAPDVLITSGAQEALDLTVRLFAGKRATVVVEDPHYRPVSMLASACGAHVQPIAVDEHGLDVEALPNRRCAFIYLTPNHQFPNGSVLSLERRHALLRWAERSDALVIEDDYDGEFRYDSRPLAPLKQLDASGRVIYVGSLSKVLSPALRMGYAVLPSGMMPLYGRLKELSSGGCPARVQKTLASLIQQGLFERHLRRVRRIYAERRTVLVSAIERHLGTRVSYHDSAAGLHLLLWVHPVRAVRWREFLLHASSRQVAAFAATSLFARTPRSLPLMLAYGGIEAANIEPGIGALADAIGSWPG
jgi:GntR family transcriptional regulator / MocR family aminotransferase